MSSRQEEKERRRKEREALEQSEQQAAARRKRLGIAGIALAAIAAIAVIAVVIAGGGDDGGGGNTEPKGEVGQAPTFDVRNLEEAARLAKCKVEEFRDFGSNHVTEAVKYESNPPTSGDHDPTAAPRGEYEAGNPPDVEQSVHSLEHGRINVQYKPGTPPERIEQLRGMVEEEVKGSSGYKTLLFQNQTGMTPAVAATAWRNSITCPAWNDRVFDAIRAFRVEFVDKGPEFIPDDV